MKTMISAAVLAFAAVFAGAADASDNYNAYDVANVVGVSAYESSEEYLPLTVQYGQVSVVSNAPMNMAALATNLVFTANLNQGDMLYVYDHTAKGYRAFELKADKSWKTKTVYSATSNGVDSALATLTSTQGWGYGFWLQRPGAASRADKRVYLAGQVPMGNVTVSVTPSVGTVKGTTLMGNPFNVAWNLNDKTVFDWTGKAKKFDTIQLNGGASTIYQFNGSSWVRKTAGSGDAVVPAGASFWYQRTKTSTADFSVTFPAVLPR